MTFPKNCDPHSFHRLLVIEAVFVILLGAFICADELIQVICEVSRMKETIGTGARTLSLMTSNLLAPDV